jgi:hypothetical protein
MSSFINLRKSNSFRKARGKDPKENNLGGIVKSNRLLVRFL